MEIVRIFSKNTVLTARDVTSDQKIRMTFRAKIDPFCHFNEASLLVVWCLLASIFDITEYFERQKLPDEDILPFVPDGDVQTYKKWNSMFTLPLIATFFAVLLLILRFFENTKAYQGLLAMSIMLALEVYVAQLITYHTEMVGNDTPELDFPDQGVIQTLFRNFTS